MRWFWDGFSPLPAWLSCHRLTLTFFRRQASQAARTVGRRGGRGLDAVDDEDEASAVGGFGGGRREAGSIGTWFGGMARGRSQQSIRPGVLVHAAEAAGRRASCGKEREDGV